MTDRIDVLHVDDDPAVLELTAAYFDRELDDVEIRVGELDDGFYVADDGPGIDPERREDVFAPGYSGSDEGTGFGLAIVREIADAHGWTVTLSDSEIGGIRFEFNGVERPRRLDVDG